jgi:hypothetical protein
MPDETAPPPPPPPPTMTGGGGDVGHCPVGKAVIFTVLCTLLSLRGPEFWIFLERPLPLTVETLCRVARPQAAPKRYDKKKICFGKANLPSMPNILIVLSTSFSRMPYSSLFVSFSSLSSGRIAYSYCFSSSMNTCGQYSLACKQTKLQLRDE